MDLYRLIGEVSVAPDWTCSHWVHCDHRKIFRQACYQIESLWKLELDRPDASSHMESEWAGVWGRFFFWRSAVSTRLCASAWEESWRPIAGW